MASLISLFAGTLCAHYNQVIMSRKLLATVALFLAVLLPVRGFAAHFIAACDAGQVNVAASQSAMPCHEMMPHSEAAARSDAAFVDADQAASEQACKLHCNACAASCSAALLAPAVQISLFDNPSTTSLPATGCSYESAPYVRADKPPVL
jgi:hypothetical protein